MKQTQTRFRTAQADCQITPPSIERLDLEPPRPVAIPAMICAIIIATILARGFNSSNWLINCLCHFPLQLSMAAAMLSIIAQRKDLKYWAIVAALTAFANFFVALSTQLVAHPWHAPDNSYAIKIAQLNVFKFNKNFAAVRQFVDKYDPDIICAQELSDFWQSEFNKDALIRRYPYRKIVNGADCQIGIFSQTPFQSLSVMSSNSGKDPYIVAETTVRGDRIVVMTLHPRPPVNASYFERQNSMFNDLRLDTSTADPHVVIVGDLNTTRASDRFSRWLRDTGLRESRQYWTPSWPSLMPAFWLPLDYGLVGSGCIRASVTPGPFNGSDHSPLLIKVQYTESSEAINLRGTRRDLLIKPQRH